MAQFFIDRPIFAWVIALFILVMGGVSIKQLPIAQYPTVAPPSIVVTAVYPGASAQTLEDSVISVIEQEMNGSPGLIYLESTSQANGVGTITLTFESGTNVDLAQVDVQNRLSRAAPRLPAAVTQQGVRVDKARSNFLLFTILSSDNPAFDPIALGDYASRTVLPEIQRLPGVGQAQLFGTERAMRIWIDPAKLVGFNLSPNDVNNAIRAQNAQVSSGTLGDLPIVANQPISATVVVAGQLTTVEQFGEIVLRANTDGSTVKLRDVARIELGGQSYGTSARLNGKPSTGIGVQLSPTGNALATAQLIKNRMVELSRYFPPGVKYDIPYDSSKFVSISIRQVVETLVEAVILVFLVMYLFLQNLRYTLIPTIVVPVALLGAFTVMNVFGYSINVLTMFAMVLAVGILVDDAIVVIENVERIMSEEGLSPRDATKKAMGQITAALIGISVTLVSVFLPMAFFTGSIGNIYRQFSLVMVSSMLFSVFLALSLTPALCATFLKPVEAGHKHEKGGLFGWFNRGFKATTHGYESWVAKILRRTGRFLMIFALIIAVVVFMFTRLPTSFLPTEDQGYLIANVQLPPGATQARTLAVMEQVEAVLPEPARGRQDGERARLLVFRQRPERRRSRSFRSSPGTSARARRTRRRHSPDAPSARSRACATPSSSRSCRRRSPSSAPRPASRSGCRTAAATATTRWSRRATSCSAWRRRARSWPGSVPTAWKTRRSSTSTSIATAPARSASRSTTSTPCSRPRSARTTSTTSRTPAACSASSSRPTRPTACSPTT